MNDPHVVSLDYIVEHDASVYYEEAETLNFEDDQLKLSVEDKKVTIWPKAHFATGNEARAELRSFLERWEFLNAVKAGYATFKLAYVRAHIVDREPTHGVAEVSWTIRAGTPTVSVRAAAGRMAYPEPVPDQPTDPDDPTAQLMLSRLEGYRQGKEPLGQMAYFCLTAAELHAATATVSNDRRKAAADYYCVSQKALNKLGELSAERGGAEARKASGLASSYTADERDFLLKAVQTLIFRAAERAANPTGQLKTITLADLPKIP